MDAAEVARAVEELAAVDVAACDRVGLDRILARVRLVQGFVDHLGVQAARRGEQLRVAGQADDPVTALQTVGGLSKRSAHEVLRRTQVLDRAAGFATVLESGGITADHVDAYGRAVGRVPELAAHEHDLVAMAGQTTPEQFEAHCHRLASRLTVDGGITEFERQRRATRLRHWIDRATGMHRLAGELDPEIGPVLWTAIERQREALFHGATPDTSPADPGERNDHLAALALVDLVRRRPHSSHGHNRPEIAVLIDHQTLVSGLHERSRVDIDGTNHTSASDLPVESIRRLACQAHILPIVLDGDSVVLDVGRSKRLATVHQRRALRAIHPTCAINGCTVAFNHCAIHHIDYWARDHGRSDLATMLPLCSRHHHAVHEGHWTIHRRPGHSITIEPPAIDVTSHPGHPSQPAGTGAIVGRASARAPAH